MMRRRQNELLESAASIFPFDVIVEGDLLMVIKALQSFYFFL